MKAISYEVTVAKRMLKAVRNLVLEFPPRRKALELMAANLSANTLSLRYHACGDSFEITVEFPEPFQSALEEFPAAPRQQLLTLLGLCFAPFFFKLADFRTVQIRTATLDAESIDFFEKFLLGGLAEFRYRHGLDPTKLIDVLAEPDSDRTSVRIGSVSRTLMLNGGGKDTIVAAELLRAAGLPFSWVSIGPNRTRRRVIEISGNTESMEISYEIDPKMLARRRYKWGHTPHASIFLAIGLVAAIITKSKFVAAGNESSANVGNVVYKGFEINHQYAKSLEFEKGLSDFVQRRIVQDVEVFSVLRPYSDLQLAQMFSRHSAYFNDFISCNKSGREGREWCKRCAKCAFTALALYPFIGVTGIEAIFCEDVIRRPAIRQHVLQLVSGKLKPWDCVGTREECVLALGLLLQAQPGLDFPDRPNRNDFTRAIAGADLNDLRERVLRTVNDQHLIPGALVSKLNRGLQRQGSGELQISPGLA
ncbi:MAG: hypothetical protein WD448_13565 [Woeseia sp.]